MVDLVLEEAEVAAAGERKQWLVTCPKEKQMVVVVVVVAMLPATTVLGHIVTMGLPALLEEVEGLA